MNILLTGATGFIGGRMLALSSACMSEEDNLILLTSREIAGFCCVVHKEYTFTAQDFLKKGITRIDKVIHIGHYVAEQANSQSMDMGIGNLSSINNTVHLIHNLPNIPDTFVYCSSMAVYGQQQSEPVDESSVLTPKNPYAASKIMGEMILDEWSEKYQVNLHILRLSHIYGPNDKRKYTIPIWLQAAERKEAIRVYTNPEMKRNCLYIDDCCRFLFRAAYLQEAVRTINVVSSYNATMYEIASLCKKISENPYDIEISTTDKAENGLAFKNSDLRELYLGKEKIQLEEGLRREYHYYVG